MNIDRMYAHNAHRHNRNRQYIRADFIFLFRHFVIPEMHVCVMFQCVECRLLELSVSMCILCICQNSFDPTIVGWIDNAARGFALFWYVCVCVCRAHFFLPCYFIRFTLHIGEMNKIRCVSALM